MHRCPHSSPVSCLLTVGNCRQEPQAEPGAVGWGEWGSLLPLWDSRHKTPTDSSRKARSPLAGAGLGLGRIPPQTAGPKVKKKSGSPVRKAIPKSSCHLSCPDSTPEKGTPLPLSATCLVDLTPRGIGQIPDIPRNRTLCNSVRHVRPFIYSLLFPIICGADFVIPILKSRKCWLREADEFVQDHTALRGGTDSQTQVYLPQCLCSLEKPSPVHWPDSCWPDCPHALTSFGPQEWGWDNGLHRRCSNMALDLELGDLGSSGPSGKLFNPAHDSVSSTKKWKTIIYCTGFLGTIKRVPRQGLASWKSPWSSSPFWPSILPCDDWQRYKWG